MRVVSFHNSHFRQSTPLIRTLWTPSARRSLSAPQLKADAVRSVTPAAADAVLAEADRQGDALVNSASGVLAKVLAEKSADTLRQQARKKSQ